MSHAPPPAQPEPPADPFAGHPKYKLAEILLGRPPIEAIATLRGEISLKNGGRAFGQGDFREIADQLNEEFARVDRSFSVSYETVRRWWELAHPPDEAQRAARERQRERRTAPKLVDEAGVPAAVFVPPPATTEEAR